MAKFYLTTAIPYVNGHPHIGHALEYFQADTIRNYHKLLGEEALLLSGADENALKNVQAAEKEGLDIQSFLDRNSKVFEEAFKTLGVSLDIFQRGSDKKTHFPGVQKLWQLCDKSGDIYKKSYKGYYCVGCEEFKTPKELIEGECPIHHTKPEVVEEENYFFKLSNYQQKLIDLIEKNQFKITPQNKRAETLSFIKQGLEDFSISRSKERAKGVGVPVPNDDSQIIYVWFDALNIYMTGIGFGTNEEKWKKYWPADLHLIGKDINRFHTVYWPAMLLSAGIELPKEILIHSFITSGGEKMSKSLGNVIDPFEMVKEFGLEPFRYYLLSQIPLEEDGDFTVERFKEVYTADLANGLGNLIARVAKLCENNKVSIEEELSEVALQEDNSPYQTYLKNYQLNLALEEIWKKIKDLDVRINEVAPWRMDEVEVVPHLKGYAKDIREIAISLQPFLPQTAQKILAQFSGIIKSSAPLFPRLPGQEIKV